MSATSSRSWSTNPWCAFAAWIFLKIAVLGLWLAIAPSAQNDVRYYWHSVGEAGSLGVSHVLYEYPTPVVALLWIPRVLGAGTLTGYVAAFIVLMVVLDGMLSYSLWRHSHQRRAWAFWWWLAFTFLMGPTAYMRFDMLPAVLAGGALLLLASRKPGWAGAAIGMGAAVKLWPALLWFALLGKRSARARASIAMWGTGGMLALVSLLWAGWDRLVSPLTWQKDRGLQVESVWASAPMVHRLFSPHSFSVGLSEHKAFEITGPGSSTWLALADASTLVGLLAMVALIVLWLRGPAREDLATAGLLMSFITGVMILTNKTFSPQYLMWLAAVVAALAAVAAGKDQVIARKLALAVLGLTLLTQLVYPIGYDGLVRTWGAMTYIATTALLLRNLGIVVVICWCGWLIITRSRRTHAVA